MSKNRNKLNMVGQLIFITLSIGVSGCAATVVAGVGTGVAVGTDSRGAGTVVDDQTLEHSINNVLDAQVPNGSFTVASHDGRVLLAGQVSTQEEKDKAAVAVTNTDGVKKVWNYLTLSINETVGDISHDTYLTSLAKSRIIGQKGVNANNIKVVTCSDVVYLLGDSNTVGDSAQIAGAIKGIESISGVKKVVNLIQAETKKKN